MLILLLKKKIVPEPQVSTQADGKGLSQSNVDPKRETFWLKFHKLHFLVAIVGHICQYSGCIEADGKSNYRCEHILSSHNSVQVGYARKSIFPGAKNHDRVKLVLHMI